MARTRRGGDVFVEVCASECVGGVGGPVVGRRL